MKKLLSLGLALVTAFALIGCGDDGDNNPAGSGGDGGGSTWDTELNGTWDYYGTADAVDLSGDPLIPEQFVIDGPESWLNNGAESFPSTGGSYYAQDGMIGHDLSGTKTVMWSYLIEDGVLYWTGSTTDGTIDKTSPDVSVFKKQ